MIYIHYCNINPHNTNTTTCITVSIPRSIFDEMTSTDLLVQKIMMFTKDLVSADRCSMFLVDEENNQLYADYFDEGLKAETGQSVIAKKCQIRFPRDKGIAGYVAGSGEVFSLSFFKTLWLRVTM